MTNHPRKQSMAALVAAAITSVLPARGAEFTYQGFLRENGVPAAGLYDLRFVLFDAPGAGTSLGTVAKASVPVSSGVFTVSLDFGDHVFDGDNRWLEISARSAGEATHATITPRVKVTPAPRVLHAATIVGGAPVGVVIDWWRASAATPVPRGYEVCDGSVVDDPQSPIYGAVLPDLRGRFIMGSADGTTVGEVGGSSSHAHQVDINHDHAAQSTSGSGGHTHNVDPPATGSGVLLTGAVSGHHHTWLTFQAEHYESFLDNGSPSLMMIWSNGLGNEGSGVYPVCDNNGTASGRSWYTSIAGGHQHQYSMNHDHPSSMSGSVASHTHTTDLPSLGTLDKDTSTATALPPYYGLLKIMRIK